MRRALATILLAGGLVATTPSTAEACRPMPGHQSACAGWPWADDLFQAVGQKVKKPKKCAAKQGKAKKRCKRRHGKRWAR